MSMLNAAQTLGELPKYNGLSFSAALNILHAGGSVARLGWNGPGQRLHLQTPNELSKMTRPYIYIVTAQGDRVPWLASQTDMLAADWYEVATTSADRK